MSMAHRNPLEPDVTGNANKRDNASGVGHLSGEAAPTSPDSEV